MAVAIWSTSIHKEEAVVVLECRRQKVVGKPYEGKPHVRFEVAGDGNQDRVGLVRHSQRKRGATDRLNLRLRRHPLTLPADHKRGGFALFGRRCLITLSRRRRGLRRLELHR